MLKNAVQGSVPEDTALLQTIKVPKNLKHLHGKFPAAQYHESPKYGKNVNASFDIEAMLN